MLRILYFGVLSWETSLIIIFEALVTPILGCWVTISVTRAVHSQWLRTKRAALLWTASSCFLYFLYCGSQTVQQYSAIGQTNPLNVVSLTLGEWPNNTFINRNDFSDSEIINKFQTKTKKRCVLTYRTHQIKLLCTRFSIPSTFYSSKAYQSIRACSDIMKVWKKLSQPCWMRQHLT